MATAMISPRLRRRALKQRVREIQEELFCDLDPENTFQRAGRVRALCPCEYPWEVLLWDIIFAACQDPSPLVRFQALHVIEDSYISQMTHPRGMRLLYAALRDPDESVRNYAADVIRNQPWRRRKIGK